MSHKMSLVRLQDVLNLVERTDGAPQALKASLLKLKQIETVYIVHEKEPHSICRVLTSSREAMRIARQQDDTTLYEHYVIGVRLGNSGGCQCVLYTDEAAESQSESD